MKASHPHRCVQYLNQMLLQILGVFIESESRGVALKEKPLKNRFGGRVAVVGGLVSGTPKAETRLSEE